MPKNDELRYGAPGETAVHLCVDMQKMFAQGTEWMMPWLEGVLRECRFLSFIQAGAVGRDKQPVQGDVSQREFIRLALHATLAAADAGRFRCL
jgi:hypothetical protein